MEFTIIKKKKVEPGVIRCLRGGSGVCVYTGRAVEWMGRFFGRVEMFDGGSPRQRITTRYAPARRYLYSSRVCVFYFGNSIFRRWPGHGGDVANGTRSHGRYVLYIIEATTADGHSRKF